MSSSQGSLLSEVHVSVQSLVDPARDGDEGLLECKSEYSLVLTEVLVKGTGLCDEREGCL